MLAKYLGIHSTFIFDEFPTPIRHQLKEKIPELKRFFFKQVLKNISAYVSISNELGIFFNEIVRKKTLIVPIIVDTSRFDSPSVVIQASSKRYICYMGNMEISKDNVDLIIRAFSQLPEKYRDIQLYLFGSAVQGTATYLNNIIINLKLEGRVFLKGKVSAEIVPSILKNACVLVSSQPDTKRASGGFPTKLGEYLVTGVPTLLSDVGENSKYVQNGVHVFLSAPGDTDAYAAQMTLILDNYDEAMVIAKTGQQFMRDNFSHIAMGDKIIEFIDRI